MSRSDHSPGRPRGGLLLLASVALTSSSLAQGVVSTSVGDSRGLARTTRVGDNRRKVNPVAGLEKRLDELEQPKAPSGPGAAAGPAGGGQEVTDWGQLLSAEPPPRVPTWNERLDRARQQLASTNQAELRGALSEPDPARVMASLEAARAGRYVASTEDLARVLREPGRVEVARLAVELLAGRDEDAAFQALADHALGYGVADAQAVRALHLSGAPQGRAVFLERAAKARRGSDAARMAIKALALEPGDDVTQLLQRLSIDWSPSIREAVAAALDLRARAGLPTQTEHKALAYGKPMDELLQEAPEIGPDGKLIEPRVPARNKAAGSLDRPFAGGGWATTLQPAQPSNAAPRDQPWLPEAMRSMEVRSPEPSTLGGSDG